MAKQGSRRTSRPTPVERLLRQEAGDGCRACGHPSGQLRGALGGSVPVGDDFGVAVGTISQGKAAIVVAAGRDRERLLVTSWWAAPSGAGFWRGLWGKW